MDAEETTAAEAVVPRRPVVVASVLALSAIAVAVLRDVFLYLVPGARLRNTRRVYVSQLASLPDEGMDMLDLRGHPLIVLPQKDGAPLALSLVCTHLGCKAHREKNGTIFCPCHNGLFDAQGKVIGGPPPAPLVRYGVAVENGAVYLEFPEA